VDQGVPGWGVGGLELHGQGAQAALGGPAEGPAVLQEAAVEVQADVGLEALGEALQNLREMAWSRRGHNMVMAWSHHGHNIVMAWS